MILHSEKSYQTLGIIVHVRGHVHSIIVNINEIDMSVC